MLKLFKKVILDLFFLIVLSSRGPVPTPDYWRAPLKSHSFKQAGTASSPIFGRRLVSFAAREGHVEIVRELLAHKDIDVNASDFQMETALHSVMVPFMNERHLEVVRMLLAMGKKLTCVNSLDGYGSNAVKYAVLYGFKEVVEEFVKCDLVNLTYYETLGGHELVGLEVLAER